MKNDFLDICERAILVLLFTLAGLAYLLGLSFHYDAGLDVGGNAQKIALLLPFFVLMIPCFAFMIDLR